MPGSKGPAVTPLTASISITVLFSQLRDREGKKKEEANDIDETTQVMLRACKEEIGKRFLKEKNQHFSHCGGLSGRQDKM